MEMEIDKFSNDNKVHPSKLVEDALAMNPEVGRNEIVVELKVACDVGLHQDNKPNVKKIDGAGHLRNNPMKIHLVIQTIFEFCSAETLKNCRLVNNQWKHVSLKTWRDKAILYPESFHAHLDILPSSSSTKDVNDPDPYQLRRNPFKNFRIQSNLTDYMHETARPVRDITRLIILRDYKGKFSEFQECISNFQSLEILELRNCDLETIWEKKLLRPIQPLLKVKRLKISESVKNVNAGPLLKCFPNLEALSIDYRAEKDDITNICWILMQTCMTERAGGRMNGLMLKELEVIHLPETPELRSRDQVNSRLVISDFIILMRNYRLESLIFHIVWGELDLCGICCSVNFMIGRSKLLPIYHVLQTCKETLKELKTSFIFKVDDKAKHGAMRTLRENFNPCSVRMEKLREVCLQNGIWGLHILAGMEVPNLQKLVVDYAMVTKDDDDDGISFKLPFPMDRVYEKLETLEFLDNRTLPGPETIKAFAKMMPKIVHLSMPLDKFTFRIVCKEMRELKTLKVLAAQHHHEELDDESLTGVSKGKEIVGPGPRNPNITDLKLLSDVHIDYDTKLEGNAGFMLTDHSVLHGFLQLPKLLSLSVSFIELSQKVKEMLENHVKCYPNIKIIPKSVPDYCSNTKPKSIPDYYSKVKVDFGDSI